MRQIYLAKELIDDGFNVKIYGLGRDSASKIGQNDCESFEEACSKSNNIILPLPTTIDKKTINTPLLDKNSKKINIDESFFELLKDKQIFCGQFKNFKNSNPGWESLNVKDYYESEDFAVLNAIPTAEAALAIGILESKITLRNSSCLVAGFGRVGKSMALILKNVGANVTVLSHTKSKSARIKTLGYEYILLEKNMNLNKFDIIYNTAPALILGHEILKSCKEDALIIDLASKPGGVDFESAKNLGLKAIHALALPGKYSPKSAANIIKQIILGML